MSLDAYGNYYPNIGSTAIEYAPNVSSGHGAPNNANGQNGNFYFDEDTNITYIKEGDVWNIVSGSITVSGGGGTLSGVVDPEGVTTAVAGTIYWNSVGQKLWVKNAGSGNTGWMQVV
jgi:hypothetical protein